MTNLRLIKMQGCGNDFLILDAMETPTREFSKNEVIALCDRNFGPGADGFLILERSEDTDAKWTFYNCDGSFAEMCGNAARCVMRFLSENYFPDSPMMTLATRAGVVKGRVLEDGTIEVALLNYQRVSGKYVEKDLKYEEGALRAFCLNTGVPHAVIEVEDLTKHPITKMGKFLVGHPAFGDAGTNVTFFERRMANEINSTTFERGVEKETFACGTGVAAAAVVFSELYYQDYPIKVSAPGGELVVDTSPEKEALLLRGPGEYVCEVEVDLSRLKDTQAILYEERS